MARYNMFMILILDVFGVAHLGRGLNKPLLEAVQPLRKQGIRVFFASNMGTAQKLMFWNVLNLKAYGENIFCSGDLNVAKPEPAFYSRVAAGIGADPDSILFFDDSAANVEAANASGWRAFLYSDVDTTLKEIENHHGL
jgi:putative hydrolase of the HAD superfamily